ncbi:MULTISPECIES: DNA polymerase/3'-5' exonuclease PolX [Streptomycetaceae]|uniref:DNA polymerase beta n=1 Tax=Streptantibioticus cattleyicolor (strain ATCC 35852 / DSM 46488 / JCM 4925 / NBRC 14057 / NRRL 8057) TaxID=1003195 RepID=F8K462_STREN|nr:MULTISPECIES: DNA polymerase/3'-5' exonuclease PolX [Streptomycetaceae]AEW92606.1 PHP C-terminal domain-containing protein [Streptantibioticus cattleyicolor NRRL 8057 = DSM 46488]MYS57387.1 DNA polymerase/3'-5' exonuclease PolX [Streptomyces sp. SID5468]CCB72961.1 PHP C-terminal domain-containing protein [Streptantibioticus cattleyicolor NRRL 8057 = DSM 46488]
MARPNEEIAGLIQEYADLLSVTGGDAFKARAYEKAARALGGHHADVSRLDVRQLREIPGVGASIAEKVAEYFRTGHIPALDERRTRIPSGVRELIRIPTLGPKKAMALHEDLGIASVDQLSAALDAGRLHGLKGFGPKTEENLRHGITLLRQAGGRIPLDQALQTAEDVVAALSAVPGCVRCAYAGSLRRMRETIGDVDVLVAAEDSAPFMTAFTELPCAAEVIAHGGTKSSLRTAEGVQVDLRVLPPAAWGAGLQYFTGSKAHNIGLRTIAVRHGLKLSEYGLFDADSGELVVSETEEEVYARLGLPWIPPPMREDRGEIAAALAGELPDPVTEADLRGDLHTHTDLTDGLAPLEDMVTAAAARGYAYYAVTDHAPDLYMQQMTAEKALAQRERVRALDRRHRGMRVLHGTELNIGPDGEVDWPDDFLAGFDLCVASIHSHFQLDRAAQTRRLIRAAENPHVDIIGHPTTRHLGRRPGIDADLEAVYAACARTGTALEVNGQPERLDLCDEDIRAARGHGVRFAVDSDAHTPVHLPYVRYAVGTAQRGWLTADEVVNTWPLRKLKSFLRTAG